MDDVDGLLKEAAQKVELGWDRDAARQTLAETMATINVAVGMARTAVEDMESLKSDVQADVTKLKQLVDAIDPTQLSSARAATNLTRTQARSLLSVLRNIERTFDVTVIVRMSLDLTRQSQIFVTMMEAIDKRYGAEDRQAQEDITEHLTGPQLLQVRQWLTENDAVARRLAGEVME